MQLAAAAGVTRLLLIFGLMEQPITGDNIPEEVNMKQVCCRMYILILPVKDTLQRVGVQGATGRNEAFFLSSIFLPMVAFFSTAYAAFCTSRCPFAHLRRMPLRWRVCDIIVAMCRKEYTH